MTCDRHWDSYRTSMRAFFGPEWEKAIGAEVVEFQPDKTRKAAPEEPEPEPEPFVMVTNWKLRQLSESALIGMRRQAERAGRADCIPEISAQLARLRKRAQRAAAV